MGATTELGFGWVTPVLSYVMACVGAGLGLRCMARALTATGRRRLNWLLTAATAIGTGIWTMHFVAMLGFSVTGTAVRYDGLLTVASLLVSIGVVGLGVFAVGYGGARRSTLPAGGLVMGVGVAAMHYLGMSAMHVSGTIEYDRTTVTLSVVVAVVASTAALWFALYAATPGAAAGAALIMGVAVTAMHYIGMAAARIHVDPVGPTPAGSSGTAFIVPLTVMLGSYLFLTSAFVALSSTAWERSAAEAAERLRDDSRIRGRAAIPEPLARRLAGAADDFRVSR